MKEYTWLYNTYNDNVYTLLFIILILALIILVFDFWKKKSDYNDNDNYTISTKQNSKSPFYNVNDTIQNNTGILPTTTPSHTLSGSTSATPTSSNTSTTIPATTSSTTSTPTQSATPTNLPTTTKQIYPLPTVNKLADNLADNLFLSDEDKAKWNMENELLDSNNKQTINDILQSHSTLFEDNYSMGNSQNIKPDNYGTIGDYATLDTLGKSLTDTLGGVDTGLGYTILEEQLGTFKREEISNQHTYDNTSNYYTGMNAKTVDGVTTQGTGFSGKFLQNNKPIFLQKDFDGVANIFAPNIIIQNPPLTSDGYPDISFQM